MKLEKIKIHSFRSVVNQEIEIDYNCKAFIGLNEAGKTNVLNAIRSLDKSFKVSSKDKSKLDNNPPVVDFKFALSKTKHRQLVKDCNELLAAQYVLTGSEQIIKDLEVKDIVIRRTSFLTDKGYAGVLSATFNTTYNVSDSLKKLKEDHEIPEDVELTIGEDEYILNTLEILHKRNVPIEHTGAYVDLSPEHIKEVVEKIVRGFLIAQVPNVQYWEYKSQFLLPSEITYEEFMEDDDPYSNTAPLYNSFLISKDLGIYVVDDLKNKIIEWKEDSSSRRKDSQILTRDINAHIKGIWQDYDQELRIELEEAKITIHVSDPKSPQMNFYGMGVRSQGFKTFISFILTISAEAESGKLENFILILDEPETHLHPSGVKYMRDELFKLADNNNYVFFATHSIFMIDRSNLRRHIIIRKENELTKLTKVDRNNILQEEVIYKALGTSLDEFSIANKNILFEGELDLKIFSFYTEHCLEKKKNIIRDYELLDGGGTKRILEFFRQKTLPNDSEWILILDNDSAGEHLPKNVKEVVSESIWKKMRSLYYSDIQNHELEDILPKDLIERSFEQAKNGKEYEERFPLDVNQEKPISKCIDEYYGKNRISADTKKLIEADFKNTLENETLSILKAISKEATIEKRRDKFKEQLPDYYEFIERVINSFD